MLALRVALDARALSAARGADTSSVMEAMPHSTDGSPMESIDLNVLAAEHLAAAKAASNGRSSARILGDHTALLRANLIALAVGATLQDHESPGDATLTVLQGSIEFHAGGESVTLSAGQMLVIPPVRHGLTALADAVVVLTVAKS